MVDRQMDARVDGWIWTIGLVCACVGVGVGVGAGAGAGTRLQESLGIGTLISRVNREEGLF